MVCISTKGQLISEWLLDVFIWTKKQSKIYLYFCPTSQNRSNEKRIRKMKSEFLSASLGKAKTICAGVKWYAVGA